MLALLVVPLVAQTAWSDGHHGTARLGTALKEVTASEPLHCFAECNQTNGCTAWTWYANACSETHAYLNSQGKLSSKSGLCFLTEDESPAIYKDSCHKDGCHCTSGLLRAAQGLLPLVYKPVKLGTVKATGWLHSQLKVMASGLSGHLDLFWDDVMDSVWIGGKADHSGAGHERGPYWLNGMVPLAAHLNATDPQSPLTAKINDQVNTWISYILDHQLASGWLGPDDGFGGAGNTYWNGWNVAASLLSYADAQGVDTPIGKRCGKAVIDYIAEVHRRMAKTPTASWSQNRWQDWVYIIHWTLDQDAQGQEQMLFDAAEQTQAQSWDWDSYYEQTGVGHSGAFVGKPLPKFPETDVNGWTMYDHGVNNAMGTKSCSTWYRTSRNQSDAKAAYHKIEMQDKYHGQPHGMFSADECFGGRALNRGIELCAVVEQMYSLQHMFRVHGDAMFLDRSERIAFNALPGTITGDMWQHQYLQQANEINALYGQNEHPWKTDGGDATGFGVEPNFGCCTANMQQGWPKFVNNLVFEKQDGTIAIGMFAPFKATIGKVLIEVNTTYPFGDDVQITVSGQTSLEIRIPSWANEASMTVSGQGNVPLTNGTLETVHCSSAETTILLKLNPKIRIETGWGQPKGQPASVVPYSDAGAIVNTSDISRDFVLKDGASGAGSKEPGHQDIRSGDPGGVSMAILSSYLAGDGHYLDTVTMSYRYVAGYSPKKINGSTLSVVILDGNDEIIRTIYQSPVLNNYSFDNYKGYSPPIPVHASGLNIANGNVLRIGIQFHNNEQNLQLVVEPDGMPVQVTWTKNKSPQPPGPIPGAHKATNAAAVLRGPLLYGIKLQPNISVVKTWTPFNNTDIDIVTDSPWNYALVLSKPMSFTQLTGSADMPFSTTQFPNMIKATARRMPVWNESMQAANEPPSSPVDCATCGAEEQVELVPYGSTDIRMSALPWLM
eukprot:m.2809 g.2809  ORF g.2809 m.2809 type:complete len:948 (-) comp2595_c0_seq1:128-2971(-)